MKLTEPSEVKRRAKASLKEKLENKFLEAWVLAFPNLPKPAKQHRFHSERKWRFDFAWELVGNVCAIRTVRLAVEIDGGAFGGGAHVRGAQQAKDNEKMNTATAMGWRVLRFNTKQMDDINDVVDFVAGVLTNAHVVD